MEAIHADQLDDDDVLVDDPENGGPHPGNGYFSGLLLQSSRDFAHCNSDHEEFEVATGVWSKVNEREGRFLARIPGTRQFLVLNKVTAVRKICKAFKDILPMARKKPRVERVQSEPNTATISPGAPSRRLVWTEDEHKDSDQDSVPQVQARVGPSEYADTGSETESIPPSAPPKKTASDDESNDRSANGDEEEIGHESKSVTKETTEVKEGQSSDAKMSRMLFKQLRALHREVGGMKRDTVLLQQDISRLTKDCGAFQREIIALKKTRGHLQHELIELRNNHRALLNLVRNEQAPSRAPDMLPRDPLPRDPLPRSPPDSRQEDALQQDLFELKRRLKEQQRLTDSLLDGGSSMSFRMDHLNPSLLNSLGRSPNYGRGSSDLPPRPGGSDSRMHPSEGESMPRGMKRKSSSRGWH